MIDKVSPAKIMEGNFVTRGLGNIMRAISFSSALRISPMLGLTAMGLLTGCSGKVENPYTIVTVSKGLTWDDATKKILKEDCKISNVTDEGVAAAKGALIKFNPSAANPDEAKGSVWEWLHGIKDEAIPMPITICSLGSAGSTAIKVDAPVCPPPITALPSLGEVEQGDNLNVNNLAGVTIKGPREKVFVTLADASLGVAVASDSIKIDGNKLSFVVSTKGNAKVQDHLVDIHDGDSVYSTKVTVKEKKRSGGGGGVRKTPPTVDTGTPNPGIPEAPPKRVIPE